MNIFLISLISLLTCSCASMINREKAIAYVQRQLDRQGPENNGPQPDYHNLRYWAASPFKSDSSDIIPHGGGRPITSPDADVFFIHPTCFLT